MEQGGKNVQIKEMPLWVEIRGKERKGKREGRRGGKGGREA